MEFKRRTWIAAFSRPRRPGPDTKGRCWKRAAHDPHAHCPSLSLSRSLGKLTSYDSIQLVSDGALFLDAAPESYESRFLKEERASEGFEGHRESALKR